CYGDFGAKHFVEPKDAAAMVDFANALGKAITHKLAYVHMPVPIDRRDDAFHRPFRDLKLPEGTALFLGVVHTQRRVTTWPTRHCVVGPVCYARKESCVSGAAVLDD